MPLCDIFCAYCALCSGATDSEVASTIHFFQSRWLMEIHLQSKPKTTNFINKRDWELKQANSITVAWKTVKLFWSWRNF